MPPRVSIVFFVESSEKSATLRSDAPPRSRFAPQGEPALDKRAARSQCAGLGPAPRTASDKLLPEGGSQSGRRSSCTCLAGRKSTADVSRIIRGTIQHTLAAKPSEVVDLPCGLLLRPMGSSLLRGCRPDVEIQLARICASEQTRHGGGESLRLARVYGTSVGYAWQAGRGDNICCKDPWASTARSASYVDNFADRYHGDQTLRWAQWLRRRAQSPPRACPQSASGLGVGAPVLG